MHPLTTPFKQINPWQWQESLGYSQALEITAASRTLYCSGQAAMDSEGRPLSLNMQAQFQVCLDNLETVLGQAGYSLADVVRLNYYTTSAVDFFQAYGEVISRLSPHGCRPCSTLLEVKGLAFPQLSVEIEAIAVK